MTVEEMKAEAVQWEDLADISSHDRGEVFAASARLCATLLRVGAELCTRLDAQASPAQPERKIPGVMS